MIDREANNIFDNQTDKLCFKINKICTDSDKVYLFINKLWVDTKIITSVTLIAIVFGVICTICQDNYIAKIISNVCYSVTAAYIFYLIQIYFPEKHKRELMDIRIRGFIVGKILDNLSCITRKFDENTSDVLNLEDADYVVEKGSDAYNNLFKCIDDFSQLLDNDLLGTIVDLTENQFLYDLYFFSNEMACVEDNIDIIQESYIDEEGIEFRKLKDRLVYLTYKLPEYDKNLSENIKRKINKKKN